MQLSAGQKLGPYEILALLGQGGMGEVYRARDTTLGRDVALKTLPDGVATDADRIARFRREAQILATLNHPLIAAIYGVEDSQGTPVLVLELVEGLTIADRLATGALPLEEALAIAHQVALALEAAHDQGIIHRDLKPANIKQRPDGTVKVLDFGLARALDPSSSSAHMAAAATVTSPALTRLGVILGTASYMSPEQARGHTVDRGADIWAFGAVLFEMLTGSRPFDPSTSSGSSRAQSRDEGVEIADTIAAVLRADPDWSRLPPATPESIRRVLRRCLEKDRRRRLGDIRDARLEIEEAQSGATGLPATVATGIHRRERLLWIGALGLVAVVATAWIATRRSSQPEPLREKRVEVITPPTMDPVSLAISPDGEKLAFVAQSDGRSQLWIRLLETGSTQPLRGTDGASFPFWSPDSRSIGFFAVEKLQRVDLDGSPPRILGPAVIGPGASWSRDGTILFSMVPDSPVFRTSANGGEPKPLRPPASEARGERYPQFLPDGRHFLYFLGESRSVFLSSIDGADRRKLLDADAAAVFAPPGELLFVRAGVLYAQRFDPTRLQVEGEPVSLATGLAVHPYGGAALSASAVGSVAYRSEPAGQDRQFVWFDRSGTRLGVVGNPDGFRPANPTLSPDGRRIAFSRSVDGNTDLWIADVQRGVSIRFTRGPMPDITPAWLPDGGAILFSGMPEPGSLFEVLLKSTTTDGDASPLLDKVATLGIAMDYSRDGRYALYRQGAGGWDIWALSVKDRKHFPVVQTPSDDRQAAFSPDTEWIAYESNESGPYEIYVRAFPGPGASIRVSTAGGVQPQWRSDGAELFYIAPDSRLMAVSVTRPASGRELTIGSPVALFSVLVTSTVSGGVGQEYAVSADGQKFLVNTLVDLTTTPISLILNRKPLP